MHELIGQVSVARCAELLTEAGDGIERSALSRYCDTHRLKLGKRGREVLVDFEAVRAHRAANYQREIMGGAVAGELPLAPVAATPSSPPAPVQLDEHRQLKAVQLRRQLREEAEEEGRLTVVAEVDAGAADAIVEMRAAFVEVRADFAERLAAELGVPPEKVRMLRVGLKRYDRVGQERFAKRIAKALQAADEGESDARDRLTALTMLAARLRKGEPGSHTQSAS